MNMPIPSDLLRLCVAWEKQGVFAVDPELRITFWNRGMEIMTGVSSSEGMGKTIAEILPCFEQNPQLREAVQGTPSNERTCAFAVPSTGRIGVCELAMLPIPGADGGAGSALGLFLDVTDLRRTEDCLRESETRFRTLADCAPVLIWMTGDDAKRVFFNRTWLLFTGHPLEKELGHGWAEGIHPLDLDDCMDQYREALRAHRPVLLEYRLRRSDGEYRWLLDRGTPRLAADGTFLGYIGSCTDVTRLKNAEEALRKAHHELDVRIRERTSQLQSANERLNDILTSVTDYVWSAQVDAPGQIRLHYLSPVVEQVTGRPPEFYLTDPEAWLSTIHPEDRPRIHLLLESWTKHKNGRVEMEYRIVLPGGQVRWIRNSARERSRPDGTLTLSGVASDITPRKRIEEELERNNAEIRDLYDNAPCGYHSVDIQGRFLAMNETELRWLGYARDEVVGRMRITDLLTPRSLEIFQREFPRLQREGRIENVEADLIRKDGTVLHGLVSSSAIRDSAGHFLRTQAMLHDITARKAASRRQAAQYAVAIAILETQSLEEATQRILQALCENLDWECGVLRTLDGSSLEWRESGTWRAPGADAQCSCPPDGGLMDRVVATRHPGCHDGSEWSALAFPLGLPAPSGEGMELNGVIELFRRAPCHRDEGLLQTVRLIGIHVGQFIGRMRLHAELIESRRKADQANEAKSRFLATMSHEVRTPVHGILGITEIVIGSGVTPVQKAHLLSVRKCGAQLLSVINELLDLSRIESGQLEIENIDFGLREIVQDLEASHGDAARQKGLELAFAIEPDVPDTLRGDPTRLRQILGNLLENSLKFTECGRVELSVEVEEICAMVIRLHIQVSDSGVGIPPDRLEAVFQPFVQADSSTSRKYGGAGLGLAIVSRLVSRMDGKIWVESELGKGSRFHVSLPFKIVSRILPQGLGTLESLPPASSLRLLVVEDNDESRLVATQMLQQAGYSVIGAANASRAFRAMEAGRFDAVLMDVQMPEVDGYSATRIIREQEQVGGRRTPIIAITANAMDGDRERCLAAGMDGYVSKPFAVHDVIRAIEGAVRSTETPDLDTALERVHGDTALLKKMAGLFLEKAGERRAAIREAVLARNSTALADGSHALKGSAYHFCASALVGAAQRLETLGRKGDWTDIDEALADLEGSLDRLNCALHALMGVES